MATLACLDAERVVARLARLTATPARIVWTPGLRHDRGLNGYTSRSRPDELRVDPDGPHVIATAAHEFIHALEFSGRLPAWHVDGCTVLARTFAAQIAMAAASTSCLEVLPLPEALHVTLALSGRGLPVGRPGVVA